MRILFTNNTLSDLAGSELYVRDVAQALRSRGHEVMAYSSQLGKVAEYLRAATIPVTDNLSTIGAPPDIIHGHHHLDTMTALLYFPDCPAVSFCHGWFPWEEMPPVFPRIRRYVAVSEHARDRLVYEHGIAPDRIWLILNFVDLAHFPERSSALPLRPRRALIFSNYVSKAQVNRVQEWGATQGMTVDVISTLLGFPHVNPGEILGYYDLVFAVARSAIEALACGASVILMTENGLGPLVTMQKLDELRRVNFSERAIEVTFSEAALEARVARYSAEDARQVSRRIRTEADLEKTVDELSKVYSEVMEEHRTTPRAEWTAELYATSQYLRQIAPRLKAAELWQSRAQLAEETYSTLVLENEALRSAAARLAAIQSTLTWRCRAWFWRIPGVAGCLRRLGVLWNRKAG